MGACLGKGGEELEEWQETGGDEEGGDGKVLTQAELKQLELEREAKLQRWWHLRALEDKYYDHRRKVRQARADRRAPARRQRLQGLFWRRAAAKLPVSSSARAGRPAAGRPRYSLWDAAAPATPRASAYHQTYLSAEALGRLAAAEAGAEAGPGPANAALERWAHYKGRELEAPVGGLPNAVGEEAAGRGRREEEEEEGTKKRRAGIPLQREPQKNPFVLDNKEWERQQQLLRDKARISSATKAVTSIKHVRSTMHGMFDPRPIERRLKELGVDPPPEDGGGAPRPPGAAGPAPRAGRSEAGPGSASWGPSRWEFESTAASTNTKFSERYRAQKQRRAQPAEPERFPKGFRAYALPDTAAKYVVEYDGEEMQKILAHSLTKASAQAAAPPGQV